MDDGYSGNLYHLQVNGRYQTSACVRKLECVDHKFFFVLASAVISVSVILQLSIILLSYFM